MELWNNTGPVLSVGNPSLVPWDNPPLVELNEPLLSAERMPDDSDSLEDDPSCEMGYVWSYDENGCVPDINQRNQVVNKNLYGCKKGYQFIGGPGKCERKRYDHTQAPGRFYKWIFGTTTTRKPLPRPKRPRSTTPYTGRYWGINSGLGKDPTYPFDNFYNIGQNWNYVVNRPWGKLRK